MSELGLEPIRKRDSVYSDPLPPQQLRGGVRGVMDQMIADRRILLAEVERLRAELARRDQQITAVRALESVRVTSKLFDGAATKTESMVRLHDIERILDAE